MLPLKADIPKQLNLKIEEKERNEKDLLRIDEIED